MCRKAAGKGSTGTSEAYPGCLPCSLTSPEAGAKGDGQHGRHRPEAKKTGLQKGKRVANRRAFRQPGREAQGRELPSLRWSPSLPPTLSWQNAKVLDDKKTLKGVVPQAPFYQGGTSSPKYYCRGYSCVQPALIPEAGVGDTRGTTKV